MMDDVILCVALEDLDRIPTSMRTIMLGGRLNLDSPVNHAGEPRATAIPAVEFSCSLLDAAITVDIMRNNDRKDGYPPTRCYVRDVRPGSAWKKIPGDATLTLIVKNDIVLNRPVLTITEDSMADARDVSDARPITFRRNK